MTSKYATLHENISGPGDARPTALQIVEDEGLLGKLSGKVMIITGCSSGIGIETARALSETGATLYLGVRDIKKGESALRGILEQGRVELMELDLNSLESVKTFAKEFSTKSRALSILINNAGVMMTPEGTTADGFETQFGTNHLGPFLLFNLLRPTLITSSTPEFNSRVVNLSSTGHRASGIHFDNISLHGEYDPTKAYGQSKTANIYMANEIERRYGSKGLHGFSVHPGGIMTGLQKHVPSDTMKAWEHPALLKQLKNPEQGAATTVWAAIGKEWEGKGGKYLEDCQDTVPAKENSTLIDGGYAKHAFDPESEKKLWEVSCKMVGIDDNA